MMAKKSDPPAKLACLFCRTTKTRCDGQNPCGKCFLKGLGCSYKPSRRGGPRRGPRFRSQIKGLGSRARNSPSPETLAGLQSVPVVNEQPDPPNAPDFPPQPITLFPCAPNSLTGLSEVIDGIEPRTLKKASNVFEKGEALQTHPLNEVLPALRSYKCEDDILNSYYIYIHPYISLLPAPRGPQYDDRPEMIQPPSTDRNIIEQSIFTHWPSSSLSLAISAILTLIPLPQDPAPLSDESISLRRSYAQLYAESALREVDSEIDNLTTGDPALLYVDSTSGNFHPDVPPSLNPVLALTILGIYTECQEGSLPRMRNLMNRAITTAMDISLHSLGAIASEAQRRAWWSTAGIHFLSSTLRFSQPIITMDDPRITTPFPVFSVGFEPWFLFLRAQNAIISVNTILRDCKLEEEDIILSGDLTEKIQQMDAEILNIISLSDRSPRQSECRRAAEAVSSQNMWMIARLIAHSARLRLHRFRAFLDIPIFLDKHCGLSAIYTKDTASLPPPLCGPRNFNSVFPFTVPESSFICLKSALVVARTFKNLSTPNPCYTDDLLKPGPCQATTQVYPRSLPFFACAAMQSSYVLFMLHHRLHAALTSERLSICNYLLNRPETGTEHQDAERLIEEMRSGVESMMFFLKSDLVFEGVSRMSREIEAAYQATFLI